MFDFFDVVVCQSRSVNLTDRGQQTLQLSECSEQFYKLDYATVFVSGMDIYHLGSGLICVGVERYFVLQLL